MLPTSTESLQVLRDVLAVFRAMGIVHAVGGSIASSLYGTPRQTQDADIAVEPFPGREEEFTGRLGEPYYVDAESIRQAIRHRSSFNLIHRQVGFKVDVFIQKDRPFEQFAFRRRVEKLLTETPGDFVDVFSAEDIILLKLEWFRLGDEISDRQWGDILGVLRTQAGKLDDAYLDFWAAQLNVSDLLQRAREQV